MRVRFLRVWLYRTRSRSKSSTASTEAVDFPMESSPRTYDKELSRCLPSPLTMRKSGAYHFSRYSVRERCIPFKALAPRLGGVIEAEISCCSAVLVRRPLPCHPKTTQNQLLPSRKLPAPRLPQRFPNRKVPLVPRPQWPVRL